MTWDKNKYKDFKVIKLKRRGPKDGQRIGQRMPGGVAQGLEDWPEG